MKLTKTKLLRTKMRRAAALLVLAVMTITAAVPVWAFTPDTAAKEAYEKKLAEAKARQQELEKSRKETEELIEQFSQQKANLEEYITELDLKLNDIAYSIFELQTQIEDTEEELKTTVQELEAAKKAEQDQYDIMKARVQYIYENGETNYIDVLLNTGSIADMLNQFEYVSEIQAYDNSLLERYDAAKKAVEDREAQLEATLDALETMRTQEELEQATVQDLYALKEQEIESVSEKLGVADEYLFTYIQEISSQSMEIDEIIAAEEKRVAEEERLRKEEEERLRREEEARKLAEQRAAEAARQKSPSKVYDKDAINYVVQTDETDPYKMIWPLPGDHRTYSKFGYRKAPIAGASTYHQGWDIGGEFGAPIVSVLAGKVIAVDYNSSAGNFVKVEHREGFVTCYFHMTKQLVKVGEYVKQGQTIGLCGSTGVSTGAHLHFGVRVNDQYVDPDPYIGHLE